MHKQRIVILSAAGLGLIACLLPWVIWEISLFGRIGSTGSANALNDWAGLLAFLAFIGAGTFGLVGEDKNKVVPAKFNKFIALGGAIAFLMTLIFIIRAGMGGGPSVSSLGIGAYISIIASIVVAAIPFVVKGEGKFEMPSGDSLKQDFKEMTEGTPLAMGDDSNSASHEKGNESQDSAKKEEDQKSSEEASTEEKKEE